LGLRPPFYDISYSVKTVSQDEKEINLNAEEPFDGLKQGDWSLQDDIRLWRMQHSRLTLEVLHISR
jgi:hypothetical protein